MIHAAGNVARRLTRRVSTFCLATWTRCRPFVRPSARAYFPLSNMVMGDTA